MRWPLVILVVSMGLLGACAANKVATLPPAPVVGVDIAHLNKGDVAQFNGTEFSPFYLNEYLQWKGQQ